MITVTPQHIAVAKTAVKFIATRTSSGVAVTLVHQNLDTATFTKLQKASVYVGAYLVGRVVADNVIKEIGPKLDSAEASIVQLIKDRENDTTTETQE